MQVKMSEGFELFYGYRHCCGETIHVTGHVSSREEAEKWFDDHSSGRESIFLKPDDTGRNCQVSYCPLKGQKPWYGFREV